MSPPWMPLYIADYRADTAHLSAAEHGAYLLLIMHYWTKGSLPAEDRQMARIACMTPDEWADARPVIADLFGEGWTHKRIDAELAHASEVISKRKAAANTRYSKRDANAPANADHMHCNSTPDAPYAGVPQPQPPLQSDANASDASAIERGALKPRAERSIDPQAFERFWVAYPHKVGKQDAAKAFSAALGRGVQIEPMLDALHRYIRTKPPDRAWCNPATWLRQGRWDDEPSIDAPCGQERRASGTDQRFAAMAAVLSRRPDSRFSASATSSFGPDGDTAQNGAGDVLPFGRPSGAGGGR